MDACDPDCQGITELGVVSLSILPFVLQPIGHSTRRYEVAIIIIARGDFIRELTMC